MLRLPPSSQVAIKACPGAAAANGTDGNENGGRDVKQPRGAQCAAGFSPQLIKPSRPFQLVVRPAETDARMSFARELRFPPERTLPDDLGNGDGWRAGDLLTFSIQVAGH